MMEASYKKLEAFEMCLYSRILIISWKKHISNKTLVELINKNTTINTSERRKLELRYDLLQLILQGKVKGKRGPGNRYISCLKNLRTSCHRKHSDNSQDDDQYSITD